MKAVIMAGGEGTRLRPLTCNIPKPMVPIVNRPMMEHILNLLKHHQITEIANTLWYLPDAIKNYFGDGSPYNVSMHYYLEDKPLGTAGSVKNAQSFLDQSFIVVSGDSLTDIDLSKAIAFHRQKQALATLVLTRVDNPLNYGVVITDEEGRITQFLEKPAWSEVFSDTVNTGIYILEPEVLAEIPQNEKYDFSKNLFPQLLTNKAPLYGYVAEGYWSDIGNLDVYRQAQQDCLDQKIKIDLSQPDRPGVWIENDTSISEDVEIQRPVYIGKGVNISSNCFLGAYSIIGDYCQLAAKVSIKRSTLWQGIQIGRETQLRGAILANNVHLDSKIQAYEGSVIGEKTTVGKLSVIAPNIKIWPTKQIASGSHITQSIVWGHQNEPPLFSAQGIKGDIRSFVTPEMISKIGLAYGGFIGRDNSIIVSSDGSRIGRLAKRALTAGLLAAGINVFDAGTVSGNLIRFGIGYLKAQGAIHCQKLSDQDNFLNMQCWDNQGFWLAKDAQRKIENMLWREDFPRPNSDQIGELAFIPDLIRQYILSVAKLYAPQIQGSRVYIETIESSTDQELSGLIQKFLQQAGCIISPQDPQIIIRVNHDKWSIEIDNGIELNEKQWWELFLHRQRLRNQHQVALPVHVSSNATRAASIDKLRVKWTKTDPRSWMEAASELGNTQVNQEQQIEHFPYIEPLVSLGEVLSCINQDGPSVENICNEERPIRVERSVFCPWESKGRVMRSLINNADPKNTSFIDGLKYHTNSGWALIAPDGDEPIFRIFCEADNNEEADALTDHFAQTIEKIILGGGD